MTRLTWQQEERPSIVSCPVTVLGLQLTVEVHAFHCSVHSSVGGWRVRHELTLWRESVILPPTQFKDIQVYFVALRNPVSSKSQTVNSKAVKDGK